MKTKYNKRRFRTLIMIVVILLCMSIGYSYLLTTLNIEGTSNIKSNTWDVHWENVNVKSGSVTGDQVPIAAHILTDTTQVEYSVILKNPGDFYEFTVDAKNAGSLDAMVSITDTKFYEANGVTQISLPNYLEYSFTYEDGDIVEQNALLKANSSETYKVKLKFKDNLNESQLPTTDKTIVIRQSITYIQADETATPPRIISFSFTGTRLSLSGPETSVTESYSTPEEVIAETGYPFFLRHVKKQDLVYTQEIGFQYNGNYYYLKGGVDEDGLNQTPIYDHNKEVAISALGENNCYEDDYVFDCFANPSPNNFNLSVYKSGSVFGSVRGIGPDADNYMGCTISNLGSDNFQAFCGLFLS